MKTCILRNLLSTLLFALLAAEGYSQETFAKKIINAGTRIGAIQSRDGSYVSLNALGRNTFLIRKMGSTGTKIWERQLRFEAASFEYLSLQGIAQTTDGGYALVGTQSVVIFSSGFLVKLGPGGAILWTKRFSGTFAFSSVSNTSDGGFIATSRNCASAGDPFFCDSSNTLVVTFSSSGSVLSAKSTNATPLTHAGDTKLVRASENEFFLADASFNSTGRQNGVSLSKVDSSGDILWQKRFEINDFAPNSLARTSDSGVLLAGSCNRPACQKNLFLLRVSNDGKIVWKTRFALNVPIQSISEVTQTSDGGYLLTGDVSTRRIFLLKINASRKVVFARTFGTESDSGGSIFSPQDGSLVLLGSSLQTMLVLKLNSEGILPHCNLPGSLNVSNRSFGSMKIFIPQIQQSNFSLRTEFPPVQVRSVRSAKRVLTVCP